MGDAVSKFVLKTAFQIDTERDGSHLPTEFNNVISSYPSITQTMMDSQFKLVLEDNSVVGLGRHPTADYGAAADNG